MAFSLTRSLVFYASLIFLVLSYTGPVYGHGNQQGSADAWMENYSLILTEAKTITEAYKAGDAIEKAGGHVYIILPTQVMLGRVPPEAVKGLVGKAKIRAIHQRPVEASVVQGLGEPSATAAAFFNEVASGAYKARKARARAIAEEEAPIKEMLPDGFETPPVSYTHYLENLQANGITEENLKAAGITLTQPSIDAVAPSPGNSDYMVGKIVFNAIFIESDGSIDANLYTWTAANKTLIQNEIYAGLSWWSNTAQSTTYNTPLTFVYVYYTVTTGYEPVLHSSGQDYLWINQIMGKLGYGSGDKFARCTAFNTAKRVAYKTNWSTVSFIGYNPTGAPSTFSDGYFAYAYIRGPYSQLLFRNDGWATTDYDIVNAHETGHLFGAVDEYYQAGYGGCTSCAASTNQVLNGNCVYCNSNSQPCMMKGNSLTLCGYTPGHLGWQSLRSMNVKTYLTTGVIKEFFAPSQAIQYKCYFCLSGPRVGTTTHALKVRFRADYYGGTVNLPSSTYDDTGWGSAGNIAPPATSGVTCYNVWWNRTVPAAAAFGPAAVTVQLSIGQYGKGAVSDITRFFVAPGANVSSSPLPPGAVEQATSELNKGPIIVPAPAP